MQHVKRKHNDCFNADMPSATILYARALPQKLIMKRIKKLAQMKSSHYYIFWGIATAAVVAGQLYVGTGYRLLHNSMQELIE